MKTENQNPEATATPAGLDANAVCDTCGKYGAYHLGERALCGECYAGCGSCCPEFGKDDLWVVALPEHPADAKTK